MSLPKKIASYRKAKGLTEQALADLLEISQSYYNMIESEKKAPGKALAAKIEALVADWEKSNVANAIEKSKAIKANPVQKPRVATLTIGQIRARNAPQNGISRRSKNFNPLGR